MDQDILMDCAIIFWNKCKVVFQKHQTGSIDNVRYLSKMENPGKVSLRDVTQPISLSDVMKGRQTTYSELSENRSFRRRHHDE